MAHFINLYNAFVRNPQNSAFVIDQAYITFGRGGHRKISITGDGLIAFAKENQRAFQLCRYTLNSFVSSILEGLSSLDSSINVAKNRPLPSRENLHEEVLYRELCKNTILDPSSFVHIELQALLLTQNIFYIMEMEDLYFRAGFSLDYWRSRLKNHPAYNSPKFLRFHTLIKFKPCIFLDSATLENDFFQKAGVIGLKKEQMSRCSVTNDNAFSVSDRRDIQNMLNLCLTNPLISYSGWVEPVTNLALLDALNNKDHFGDYKKQS